MQALTGVRPRLLPGKASNPDWLRSAISVQASRMAERITVVYDPRCDTRGQGTPDAGKVPARTAGQFFGV